MSLFFTLRTCVACVMGVTPLKAMVLPLLHQRTNHTGEKPYLHVSIHLNLFITLLLGSRPISVLAIRIVEQQEYNV